MSMVLLIVVGVVHRFQSWRLRIVVALRVSSATGAVVHATIGNTTRRHVVATRRSVIMSIATIGRCASVCVVLRHCIAAMLMTVLRPVLLGLLRPMRAVVILGLVWG